MLFYLYDILYKIETLSALYFIAYYLRYILLFTGSFQIFSDNEFIKCSLLFDCILRKIIIYMFLCGSVVEQQQSKRLWVRFPGSTLTNENV